MNHEKNLHGDDSVLKIIRIADKEGEPPLSEENYKLIFSFGGGSYGDGSNVSFPNIFLNKGLCREKNGRDPTFIIIAFDKTFENEDVRNNYARNIKSLCPPNPRDDESLKFEIFVYTIAEYIPSCHMGDPFSIRALYELQQVGSSFDYYRDKVCKITTSNDYRGDDSFASNFTELCSLINKFKFDLLIHNDAWHNTSGIAVNFDSKLSVGRIVNYGINFEFMPIIPHLLLHHYNNENLYMIRSPNFVNFLDPNAVLRRGHPKFKDADLLKEARALWSGPEADANDGAGAAAAADEPVNSNSRTVAAGNNGAAGGAGRASPRRGGGRTKKQRKMRKLSKRRK
jgi:hypothetical protein